MNLLKKLIDHKKSRPTQKAVQYFKRGNLYSLNWTQVYDRVEQLYNALLALEVGKGDLVAIYSDTCKEWGFCDMAILATGAASVPIYHSSHKDDVAVILEEVQPKVVFVQNEKLYNKLKTMLPEKNSPQVVVFEEFSPRPEAALSLTALIDRPDHYQALSDQAHHLKPNDLATIIYTSGTSGRPKGVCIHHEQIMSSTADVFPLLGVTPRDRTLTFLPLSHVLGRMELFGHYFCGYTISYAESIEKIKANLLEVQPTVIVGVPRIFEKIFFGIKAQIEISKLKQGLFNRALRVGKNNYQLKQKQQSPSLLQAFKARLAYEFVFSNIQNKLGGKLRFAVSGGAPLDPEIAEVFASCDIPILEGYGLTETTGPIFVNTLFANRNGFVGKAVGDVKIKQAEDGEILVKSKKVMAGYFKNPEATQAVFDDDGYFKTGDIGQLSSDGFLQITDRKKDLIKTAGGKFVAPQKLQNRLATEPLIGHIHVHGDKKKYIVALITLENDQLLRFKKQHNLNPTSFKELSQCETVQSEVRQIIANMNASLASFETIKRFKVLDHEFTIEDGQLTPSLKMKRKKIDEMYKTFIDDLYR